MGLPLVRSMRRSFDSIVESRLPTSTDVPLNQREDALRKYGDFTLAYSACYQSKLNYFGDRHGFIAYGKKMGNTIVLGDPMVDSRNCASLLKRFVDHFKSPVFCQIGNETASHLGELGYRINGLGVDTILDLDDYGFGGKSKERFRYASNWLKKHGYKIREMTYAELGRPRARRLTVQWRRTRTIKRREVAFLNRPLVFRDEPDMRNFYLLDPNDNLVAFAGFDPLYRDNQVIGYVTTFKRRGPDAPAAAEPGMMKSIVEIFQSEGRKQVNLGLSPLASIEKTEFRSNPFLNFSFGYGFRAGWVNRYFYNLKGHADYKRRFGGRQVQTYYASKKLFNDVPLIGMLRLCKVI